MRMSILGFVLLTLASGARSEERRLITDGRINNLPARFMLDTGTTPPLTIAGVLLGKYSLKVDDHSLVPPEVRRARHRKAE